MLYLQKETDEVYYVNHAQRLLTQQDTRQLKHYSTQSLRNRARFCMHTDKNSAVHEMFEMLTNQVYMRPHKQEKKTTSYHVIFGSLRIYLFHEMGEVTNIISLADYFSEKPFYFRAPKNTYRTLVPMEDFVLYHETTAGPFNKRDTVFAPWSPTEKDHSGIEQFKLKLKNSG